jgi:hypothetical protein
MNSDKLGWMVSAPGAHARSPTQRSRKELERLENAVRAQLMHVAIECTRSTTRSIRMMIDLSVFLSMESLTSIIPRNTKRGSMLSHQVALPKYPVEDERIYHKMALTDAYNGVICTMAMHNLRDDLLPVSGEPVTLRLLFDGDDTHVAKASAEQICERFSHWDAAGTSLKQALSAIQSVIAGDAPAYAQQEHLLYRSACIQRGWQADNLDTSCLTMIGHSATHLFGPKLPSSVTEFCLYAMVDTWSETARRFNPVDPILGQEPDGSDPATSVDAADGFVSADTMSRLWYGKKRRPNRD